MAQNYANSFRYHEHETEKLLAGTMIKRARTPARSVSDGKLKDAPPFPQPTHRYREFPPSRTVPLPLIPLPLKKSITVIQEKEAGSLQIQNVRL